MKHWLQSHPFRTLAILAGTIVLLAGAYSFSGDDSAGDLPATVDFNEHIRPILSANCYVCHGPDISTREAGLRLDLRDSAIVALESGETAVVPGHSEVSELIRRVSSDDPEEQMPPPEMKKVLSDREVGLLKKWIDQGAEWKEHWSLVPPEKPALPRVRRTWQVENDIDHFVLAAMEERGLAPAAEADKAALIRRLSFVLTGLPPTPEGLDAFLADESPDAYERLVDRLLASPHFGERWARHWMDLVRFANTRGHEFDYPVIGANQYRDYLIRAFNADVPYDQLVKEHLAGDLIEHPRMNPQEGFNESAIGTVFYSLGEGKHSPVDTQQEEYDRTDIVIDVTSKTFQGLTVACARCHDHKFDPIPTTDYYALYGIVKSSRYALRTSNMTTEVRMQIDSLALLRQKVREIAGRQWVADASEMIGPLQIELEQAAPVDINNSNYQVLGDFTDGGYDNWIQDGEAFEVSPAAGMPRFESGELISLKSPRVSSATLSPRLMGALRSPDFVLDYDFITVRAAGQEARVRVIMDNFQLIQYPIYGGLEAAVDTSAMQDYTFDLRMWKGKKMYIELLPGKYERQDFVKHPDAYIEAQYVVAHNGGEEEAREIMPITREATELEISGNELGDAVSSWQRGEAGAANIAVINGALEAGGLSDKMAGMEDLLTDINRIEDALPAPELYLSVRDGIGADHPVFIQGAMTMPSDSLVPRRGFTLHDKTQSAYDTAGSGRMHFAEALLDPANPLTARVMVNRLWHYVYGRGIVETVDNFGVQGKYPSHPELLDYLAVRFVEDGWSIKRMIRAMVLSKTFRRSTVASEDALRTDPDNIYLQHYPVRRLEAEAIRDAMLMSSGRFDPTMFGNDIPVHLTEFMEGRGRPGVSGPLDGDGRRSIYLSIRRNFLQPFMLVFDMPIPFTTFGKRNASNVPAQSLTLLNDPFVLDQAEHWAHELIALKELDAQHKIAHIYKKGLARAPSKEEIDDGIAFLQQQAVTYGLDFEGADIMNDHRPWRDYCHAIFNLKEFIHLI